MVKIRLSRIGAKGQPYYRVVVVDERKKRDGRVLEIIGRYNPRVEPSSFEIDQARLKYWRGVGAQLTEPVQVLLGLAKPKRHAEKNTKPATPAAVSPASGEAPANTEESVATPEAESKANAPETTPPASPELAKAEAASEEASVEAAPEVVEQVVEKGDMIAESQVAEDHEPTTQEEKASDAEQVQETASEVEEQGSEKTTPSPTAS
ncbi:MAG TPA: 30S ribosomal protein S16 [Patescibacteria group bacterium]|nr:30S ribosomal protein S16 [Patescibacteria group bacterium]